MTTIMTRGKDHLHTVLAAAGRSSEIPESADAYGWLIGSWELDVRRYVVDVATRHIKGEAHFGWVLEGRAVQDVWIMPRRSEHTANLDKILNMYGTTLRVWDPSSQAWRVCWIDPATGNRDQLIGRWSGKDVVQIGAHSDGTPIRWIFTEITPDSFHWIGEALNSDGIIWKIEGEFLGRRIST
jgi:hypothetical protein